MSQTKSLSRRETRAAYLFISPWLVGFILFTAGPMIAARKRLAARSGAR